MGKKRKNKDPGGSRQVRPQQSFQQMVGDATLNKFKGYIDMQLQGMGQALIQRQAQMQQQILTRIIGIEEILAEKFEDVTKDALAARMADIQDRAEGFETVEDGALEIGDRVRLEIKVKQKDSEEFADSSRFMVDNAGSGATLGKELEDALVGMKVDETKEVKFGKDKSLTASLYVNKISRRPKPEPAETEEKTEEKVETQAEEKAAEVKEEVNANPNAG